MPRRATLQAIRRSKISPRARITWRPAFSAAAFWLSWAAIILFCLLWWGEVTRLLF